MSVTTDLHTESLLAQFRAQRTQAFQARNATPKPGQAAASSQTPSDSVEISLSANMTVQAANTVMTDAVADHINKLLHDAGIDLTVEDARAGKLDMSPDATAQRIVAFASRFLNVFRGNHASESSDAQFQGFMSLTRAAIKEGFQQARDFLNGITQLSDAIQKHIDDTYALTNTYLDQFYQAQTANAGNDAAQPAGSGTPVDPSREV